MRTIASNIELARPTIQEIVEGWSKRYVREYSNIIGRNMSTKMAFEKFQALSGFGIAPLMNEAEDIPVADMSSPFTADFYVNIVGLGYEVSGQTIITDIHGVLRKPTEALARALEERREVSAAQLLENGFVAPASGGTFHLEPVALFSAAHPTLAGNQTNLLNAALSVAAVQQGVQLAGKTRNYSGTVWRPMRRQYKLFVPTELELLAEEIAESVGRADTSDRADNVLKGRIQVVPNSYFNDINNWYLVPMADDDNPFFMMTRRPRTLVEEEIPRRLGDRYFGFGEEWGMGAEDWRGLVGSNV